MSAITGIFYRDGRKVDPELIKKMNNGLSHRGPDGSAVWCEGPVALGHQMLWTTPESLHEKLPFEDEESGLVITADARIDNRDELSKELNIEDKEEVSDSYFILKAYSRWGEDCPDKLLGDFAFAIWDKNEKKLFCARDHMGVKPFYYYLDDKMFVFGTEIKALFCVPEVPYNLNEQMVAFYLMGINDYKSTFYEDIFSFIPAHSLTMGCNSKKVKEYWKLDPKFQITMNTEEDYINAFREIFAESVRCRLRSAFPVGFELSGGMDSSSIVCMTKKIIKEDNYAHLNKINTFSFLFNDFPQCDERDYIETVVNTEEIEPHFIYGDKISPLEQMETILWHQEQPLLVPNLVFLLKLSKKMQENNIRVVLCGTGGDSVVSHGNYYLRDLAFTLKWRRLIKEYNSYTNHFNLKFYKFSFYYYFLRDVFPSILATIKWIINRDTDKLLGISMLNKDFSNELNAEKYLNQYWEPIKKANTAKKYHYYALNRNKANINALMMRDRMISAFSMDSRYPFLDKRLVEFCYAIPAEMKFKFGWSRYILRIAMKDILPPENQWRATKANLSPVYKKNMLLFEKNLLDEVIFSKNKIIKDYVNIDKLKDIYQKFIKGVEVSNSPYTIFLVSQLFLWLNQEKLKNKN